MNEGHRSLQKDVHGSVKTKAGPVSNINIACLDFKLTS